MDNGIPFDLIARAQRGSPEDISWLYTRFHQRVYRYLFYRTADLHIAEDLTADVFVKMIQALPTYRFETIPFQAWLFQVARNLAIDHFRRGSAHPVVVMDENLDGDDPEVDRAVEFNLTSVQLAEAVAGLDDAQRDVVLMRFVEGMPIAEVAQILHRSEDSVKALQRRGLQALRVRLSRLERDYE